MTTITKVQRQSILLIPIYVFSLITILSSCKSEGADYVDTVVEEPTQGVLAEIEEVKQDIFKIVDEEVIDKREDSRIVANFMDGTRDTFTLDEISLTQQSDSRGSAIRSIAMGGMLGYMMGRGLGSPLSRSAYKSDAAFNKSSTSGSSAMRSTATRKTVRTPKPAGSGYGKSKSSRSYGG